MKRAPVPEGHTRSPHWPTVERRYKKTHPTCAACGRKSRLGWRQLDVHHVVPFHIDPTLELDPGNLITLCRGLHANKADQDHFTVGHHGNWSAQNPHVREEAAAKLHHLILSTVNS